MNLSRTAWHDWYVDEAGESAIFVGDQVMALSVLPTAVLGAVTAKTSFDEVLDHVMVALGPIDRTEAGALLQAAIDQLVDAGILAAHAP